MERLNYHKPKSHNRSAEDRVFWKSLDGLTVEDMTFLITKRILDMKWCNKPGERLKLKTHIAILRDAIQIARLQSEDD